MQFSHGFKERSMRRVEEIRSFSPYSSQYILLDPIILLLPPIPIN
jgi:hypothetical protein